MKLILYLSIIFFSCNLFCQEITFYPLEYDSYDSINQLEIKLMLDTIQNLSETNGIEFSIEVTSKNNLTYFNPFHYFDFGLSKINNDGSYTEIESDGYSRHFIHVVDIRNPLLLDRYKKRKYDFIEGKLNNISLNESEIFDNHELTLNRNDTLNFKLRVSRVLTEDHTLTTLQKGKYSLFVYTYYKKINSKKMIKTTFFDIPINLVSEN